MTDTWDELWNKPAFNFLSYSPDDLVKVPGKVAVDTSWLHEVKAEGGRLREKAEKWDKLGESIEKARNQDPPKWWLDEANELVADYDKIIRSKLFPDGEEEQPDIPMTTRSWTFLPYNPYPKAPRISEEKHSREK